MVADPLRGEADVELAGKKYVLKLTLAAMRQAETKADTSWQMLINRAFSGELRIDDIAAIIWAGMIGSGVNDPPEYEAVAEMVFDEGLVKTNVIARDLMLLQAIGQARADDVSKILEGLGGKLEEATPATTGNGIGSE